MNRMAEVNRLNDKEYELGFYLNDSNTCLKKVKFTSIHYMDNLYNTYKNKGKNNQVAFDYDGVCVCSLDQHKGGYKLWILNDDNDPYTLYLKSSVVEDLCSKLIKIFAPENESVTKVGDDYLLQSIKLDMKVEFRSVHSRPNKIQLRDKDGWSVLTFTKNAEDAMEILNEDGSTSFNSTKHILRICKMIYEAVGINDILPFSFQKKTHEC